MDTPPFKSPGSPVQRQRRKPLYAVRTTIFVAILLATVFVMWTPTNFSIVSVSDHLALLLTPQAPNNSNVPVQQALRIGIVSGHRGNDSGAVCLDSNGKVTLTEADVNFQIASLVQKKLNDRGFQVDLLNEYDTRLNGYRAVAILSIHNDSCEYINDQATGFKVAAALNTRDQNRAGRLLACMVDRYQTDTGLKFHPGSITADMTSYHAFSEIDPDTIAAIIETGFLNLDRAILTQHTDQVADGIVSGLLCFVNNENVEPTPIPTP
ncbi:MAG: N-acetylmuramoyl-L-alanine amidase [Chloroflexi bacterium]|nr:N-acetylmuramoyl-L-alanine amidase [Chloroflexota bacterium]MBI1855808.1 N-acetylmuramoyl-L-alanine amidase [Chloroflexota bacterium]MBI3340219.1 N-acetylmuramoyl-L-alanine amidase [Chloroflexota bacterium]